VECPEKCDIFPRGREVIECDSERVRTHEIFHDERSVAHPIESDDDREEALWAQFESQFEGDWEDDAYSFAEDDCHDLEIPSRSGMLIDSFPSLETTSRERVLGIVKLLIEKEISQR